MGSAVKLSREPPSSVRKVQAIRIRIDWYRLNASKSLSPVTITSALTATAVAMTWSSLGSRQTGPISGGGAASSFADLFQFRAPPNDRRLAMAVDVSQAGREKGIAGFIEEQRR